jgi:hypothetical protein
MAETAELVERTVTIRTAMKIEIDQILFIKTSVEAKSYRNSRQGMGQQDIRTKCPYDPLVSLETNKKVGMRA